MELDIIYVIPVLVIVGIIWFVYRLGIEVGRVMQHNEERARREARREYPTGNVIPLRETVRIINSEER